MKRITKITAAFLFLLAVLAFGVSADGVYSSQEDPLVSLSYVNDVLAPQIMSQVMARVEKEYAKADGKPEATGSYSYVQMKQGQTLMADGCCEIVLLSGSASVLVTGQENLAAGEGLVDITAGQALANGSELPVNHGLIAPKGDGRGFRITSVTAAVLVRGEYHIV